MECWLKLVLHTQGHTNVVDDSEHVSNWFQVCVGFLCVGIAYRRLEFPTRTFVVGKIENQLSNICYQKFLQQTVSSKEHYRPPGNTVHWGPIYTITHENLLTKIIKFTGRTTFFTATAKKVPKITVFSAEQCKCQYLNYKHIASAISNVFIDMKVRLL